MPKLVSKFRDMLSKNTTGPDSSGPIVYKPNFALGILFPQNIPQYVSFPYQTLFRLLVNKIDLPNLQVDRDEFQDKNFIGTWRIPGKMAMTPDRNEFTITFYDTEKLIFENFIYPWMKEIVETNKPEGTYPFPRATIYVATFRGNVEITEEIDESDLLALYTLYECYPNFYDTPDLHYGPNQGEPTRNVSFSFNRLIVTTMAEEQYRKMSQKKMEKYYNKYRYTKSPYKTSTQISNELKTKTENLPVMDLRNVGDLINSNSNSNSIMGKVKNDIENLQKNINDATEKFSQASKIKTNF